MSKYQLPDPTKFKAVFASLDGGESKRGAARAAGVPESTVRFWCTKRAEFAAALGLAAGQLDPLTLATQIATQAPEPVEPEVVILRRENATLKTALKSSSKDDTVLEYIKTKIFGLKEEALKVTMPAWMTEPGTAKSRPGVPTLFASDWHVGEVVFPTQINNVNEYNMEIARTRAHNLIERTIDLLENHMVNPVYPGIVFALGGDMVSGDIHDELVATNDVEIMPCVLELVGILKRCCLMLADRFGHVFIPCVGGNHGRNTHKIRAKGRNYTSFDWLIYRFLELCLRDDKRITFYIPDGSDALYRVYNHRYLLTHGDQFRGGDGVIGALGPIIRGDHRKRSRNGQIGMEYDTMIIGHWHQWIMLQRLIVNGSLKGYDEYAYTSNFPFERPRQGLWLTHPKRGITFALPVNVDDQPGAGDSAWVSVPDGFATKDYSGRLKVETR
jgi:transposase-like protein